MIHKTIYIIKKKTDWRQIKFAWLVMGEPETLDEAKQEVKEIKQWTEIEVWKDWNIIESFDR